MSTKGHRSRVKNKSQFDANFDLIKKPKEDSDKVVAKPIKILYGRGTRYVYN